MNRPSEGARYQRESRCTDAWLKAGSEKIIEKMGLSAAANAFHRRCAAGRLHPAAIQITTGSKAAESPAEFAPGL